MRLTQDDLDHTTGCLGHLAHRYDQRNNLNGFPDLATLIDLALWLDTELEAAKAAAVYGPGGEVHTIGGNGHSPVEGRLNFGSDHHPRLRPELSDPLYQELRKLQSGLRTELGQLVDSLLERARKTANWPKRSEQSG